MMPADNSQKTPFARSLSDFTQGKIADGAQLIGKSLPATVVSAQGSIVTVKFEVNSIFTLMQVTVPLFGPEYIRYPMRKGDPGAVIAMDARLGGLSGLGGGVASLDAPANLAALVFLPFGNTEWQAVDPNAVVVRGPNGVVLEDETNACTFVLTPTTVTCIAPNSIKLHCGTSKLELTPSTYLLSGTTGSISDGSHATSASLMNSVWAALVTWANTHTHPVSGSTATATNTPYTGGSISP